MAIFDYQIASDWDNVAGFTNVEDLVVSGAQDLTEFGLAVDTHFWIAAMGLANINEEADLSGGVSQSGHTFKTWSQFRMNTKAFTFMLTTYAQQSSLFGKVTVRTRVFDETYANYNALLKMIYPQQLVIEGSCDSFWYSDVQMILALKESL
jgi:hypothetical protein